MRWRSPPPSPSPSLLEACLDLTWLLVPTFLVPNLCQRQLLHDSPGSQTSSRTPAHNRPTQTSKNPITARRAPFGIESICLSLRCASAILLTSFLLYHPRSLSKPLHGISKRKCDGPQASRTTACQADCHGSSGASNLPLSPQVLIRTILFLHLSSVSVFAHCAFSFRSSTPVVLAAFVCAFGWRMSIC